jgi:hypothetical protein
VELCIVDRVCARAVCFRVRERSNFPHLSGDPSFQPNRSRFFETLHHLTLLEKRKETALSHTPTHADPQTHPDTHSHSHSRTINTRDGEDTIIVRLKFILRVFCGLETPWTQHARISALSFHIMTLSRLALPFVLHPSLPSPAPHPCFSPCFGSLF